MLDYVLEKTKSEKIFVVAHSQGCTSLMVLLSLRPQYNDKIIHGHLLAPAVFMKDLPHPFIRFFASEFNAFVDRYKNYDIMSSTQIMKFIQPINSFLCQHNSPIINMCTNILSMVCGRNDNGTETDTKILPVLTKYLSKAVSTKQFHHFIQLYHSGKFQHYDYQGENRKTYNQTFPPEYPLKNVRAPMHLYSGVNDMLVAEKDIERLKEVLKNVVTYKSLKNYNHCDFLYGRNSRNNIYQNIVTALGRTKN
jgi:pimeloyl-ACP methyl ester carboxylesterase